MLGVSQCLGLGRSQVGIITRVLNVAARRQVALMFGVGCLFYLLWSEFRVIALIPAIGAILSIPLKFRSGSFFCSDRSQLCVITQPRAVCTVGCIELTQMAMFTSSLSAGVSLDRPQESYPSLQAAILRCRCAAVIPRASIGVSLDRSHDNMPSLQSDTFRW
jgi:hypothetical protein